MNRHKLLDAAHLPRVDLAHVPKHRNYGFTVIELIVVISVIGILSAIGAVAYNQVQKQARDDARNADMIIMQNQLETFFDKHGEYPPGCPRTSCTSWFSTENTSSLQMINASATIANLTSVLPRLHSEFGDPMDATTTPIMDTAASAKKYYYFGGGVNNRTSASSLTYASTASFPCSINTALSPGEVSSYVLGYYSEMNNTWVLTGGKKGKPMTITAGTPAQGCVINRS